MITSENLTNKIYSNNTLFKLIERNIFFYGLDQSYKIIHKKLNQFNINCSLQTLKESLDYIFKIKYLIFIQELCHKSLYKYGLNHKIKNIDVSNVPWDIIKETQDIIPSIIITPYILKDMSKFLNTGTI